MYQSRLALLKLLELPEDTIALLEADDDIEFVAVDGVKSLASLKHKAPDERLTDLSTDFWKSVRIWLTRYKRDGRIASSLQFFLLTTNTVSDTSFLKAFQLNYRSDANDEAKSLVERAEEKLTGSKAKLIDAIAAEFNELTADEKNDFLTRICILDESPRIGDIPTIIADKHMRSIRREHRIAVLERLEGWWNQEAIRLMTGERKAGVCGREVSDKLFALSGDYKDDSLPITFRGKEPDCGIDTDADPRTFVAQLREIGISPNRIGNAIRDYYRAFEQRSEWARENLLVPGEIEDYEDRLVDEWNRCKDVIFEGIDEKTAKDILLQVGKELYKWADQQSCAMEVLRIRVGVTEPFVTRGSFHILADDEPEPRVYWHPRFLERLAEAARGLT